MHSTSSVTHLHGAVARQFALICSAAAAGNPEALDAVVTAIERFGVESLDTIEVAQAVGMLDARRTACAVIAARNPGPGRVTDPVELDARREIASRWVISRQAAALGTGSR